MYLEAIRGKGSREGANCALYELIVEQLPVADRRLASEVSGLLWREIDRQRLAGAAPALIDALEGMSVQLHSVRCGVPIAAARMLALGEQWKGAATLDA
jgi:hypothetical protein